MLKQFSRLERSRNVIIILFALLMGVSLIVFYAPGRNNVVADPTTSNEVLARVRGDEVTVADLSSLKESYQQMFGGQISLAQLGGNKQFLNGLIRDRIVSQEAARLGLAPSDVEVRDSLVKQFKDPSGKFVGFDRYKEIVLSRYGSIDRFERQVRDSIAADKLRAFVTAGVTISDQEVQDDYKRKNTTFDIVYVPVVSDQLAKKIQPSDEEIRKYYEDHKDDFKILAPQKKIRYLFVDQVKIGEKLNIPEQDLQAEYDKLTPENKQLGVRVQQIVLKVARPDLDAQIKGKADGLVKEAKSAEGGKSSEQKFAELARGNSEDPATAKNGGWLPAPVKKDVSKSADPVRKVVDMQPGDVAGPIKSGNAYYIFRRGDPVPKSFEQAKTELLVSMRTRRAYAAAAQLAARAVELLKQTKDVLKVAQELAPEANMKPAEMVRETGFIKPGDTVPDIGSSPQFEQAIEPLNNPGDVGDRTGIKNGFAIPMLVEKRYPRIPDLDEVKDKIITQVKDEKAKSELQQTARELAGNANNPADLKAAGEKLGLQPQTSDKYKLGSALVQVGTSPAADEAIYSLKAGEVTKTPLKIGESWVVLGVTNRTEADLTEFAKQRQQLTEDALRNRRNDVYEDYVSALRERLDREGKITIYDDVLAQLTDEEEPPVAQPPRMPRNLPVPHK